MTAPATAAMSNASASETWPVAPKNFTWTRWPFSAMKMISRMRNSSAGISAAQTRPVLVRWALASVSSRRLIPSAFPASGVPERFRAVALADRARLVAERSADDVDAVLVDERRRRCGRDRHDDRLGVRTAAVVDRDDEAVVRSQLVRARAERLPQRAGQGDEEPAGRAGCGSRARDRRLGPPVTGVPPLDRVRASVEGQHPGPAQTQLEGHLLLVLGLRVEQRRDEPRVVGAGREQVTDAQVARTQPLAPRNPLRREQCVVAGEQHDLVDADGLGARRADERDRPAPAAVGGVERREEVRDDAFLVGLDPEVVADKAGGLLLGGGPREDRKS